MIYAGTRWNKLYLAAGKLNKDDNKNIDECVLKPWFIFPSPSGWGYSTSVKIYGKW